MNRENASTRELMAVLGGNLRPTENRKGWLNRIAQNADLSYRLARAAWYGERLSFETERKLRLAVEKNEQSFRDAASRLEAFTRHLAEKYPEVYRAEGDAFSDLARRIRALDW